MQSKCQELSIQSKMLRVKEKKKEYIIIKKGEME